MPKSHCAESTAERAQIDISNLFGWSSLVIPGHSSNDNDNVNQFEQCSSRPCSFSRSVQNVQKCCVPSTINFHSYLCTLKTCSYRLCRTVCVLFSSYSYCIRWMYFTNAPGSSKFHIWTCLHGIWAKYHKIDLFHCTTPLVLNMILFP